MVWGNYRALNIERLPAKAAEYEDYTKQTEVFDAVAAYLSIIPAEPVPVVGIIRGAKWLPQRTVAVRLYRGPGTSEHPRALLGVLSRAVAGRPGTDEDAVQLPRKRAPGEQPTAQAPGERLAGVRDHEPKTPTPENSTRHLNS